MTRSRIPLSLVLSLALVAARGPATLAGEVSPGIISHISVTSDKVADVSSLEAWKKSFIQPGMSDREKAIAIWKSSVSFRHQDPPPREFINNGGAVHDPIQAFNVYGYGMCSCASAHMEALARYIGMEARGWGITGHSVPEIKIDGKWSMLDSSLVNYYQKPDGSIAGVEEIGRSIVDWRKANPAAPQDQDGLFHYMINGGWRKGPTILTNSPFYDNNGWLPAATHGWNSSMSEFGSPDKNFVYEYGSALGYEVNIQLRPGEVLTRNWSNKGLHVNMDLGETPSALTKPTGTENLRYTPAYGDLSPGRVGNGTVHWSVPMDEYTIASTPHDNLAAKLDGHVELLCLTDQGKPGVLVVPMRSSYVYLGGTLQFNADVAGSGSVVVELSDNNGLDWKPVKTVTTGQVGRIESKVDLKPFIFRRYDYLLRFTLNGPGTRLQQIDIDEDIQHSQRALPALDRGDNTITFHEGPQEGTVTVNPTTSEENKGKNVFYTDFRPTMTGITGPNIRVAGQGSITFPIGTPGDITRVRVGAHYRARDAKDGFNVEASFDQGATWRDIGKLDGPTPGLSKYFVFSDVPKAAKKVLVRFNGTQRNTTLLIDLRIDVDYREPHGADGPVRIIYNWEENGVPHQDVHLATKPEETYKIHCNEKPLMRSITLARPSNFEPLGTPRSARRD